MAKIMTELEEILKDILDVDTDYNSTMYGDKVCRWCGKYTDFQNKFCDNKKCPAVRARSLMGKK